MALLESQLWSSDMNSNQISYNNTWVWIEFFGINKSASGWKPLRDKRLVIRWHNRTSRLFHAVQQTSSLCPKKRCIRTYQVASCLSWSKTPQPAASWFSSKNSIDSRHFSTTLWFKVFSTLNYVHSFLQWRVNPSDRHKTCFSGNGNRYQFVGAPFGLKPLTGIVQNTQNRIFKDSAFVGCYVDDLIVHSKTIEEHGLHLQHTIQLLNKFNIKLNCEKFVFVASKVVLLGLSSLITQ